MDLALDIISAILLAAGTFFVFAGGVGVMRMPDFYTRMHAASLTDTGGAALIIAGLLLQGGLTLAPVKLLAIFLFLFLTSPTASYALVNAALLSGLKPRARNETGAPLPEGEALQPVTRLGKRGTNTPQDNTGKAAAKQPAAKKAAAKKPAEKKPAANKKAAKKS
ncbi:MAG: monovalent cation/H(+) antiporter subunit G [Anderseniella sp.]|jgi:multicomponent Na+:H+ antiporter subunit G|nr:monovalent cation/H(+) antiporter subunit G [Anderseniella sp.]